MDVFGDIDPGCLEQCRRDVDQFYKAVSAQIEKARAAILKHKDHPALLAWAVGNEAEGEGNNPAVWYAIDHVARMCKEIDPNHPTMTVVAEVPERKVKNLHRFCPAVDIVGINTYGGADSVIERYRKAGGTKPCVITEFGPHGQWEVEKRPWGAPLELTSTAKAKRYREVYDKTVVTHAGFCLGSYAFLWGHKQEATATWFGLYLPDGTRLGGVQALTEAWGGRPWDNACPRIRAMTVDRDRGLKPGDTVKAKADISDPDGDAPQVEWVLRRESGRYNTGGDAQPEQAEFTDAILVSARDHAEVRIPAGGGGYRLFAYVRDGKGNGAVANVPLHVKGKVIPPPCPKATVPFVVYADLQPKRPYIPSGYMGNTGAIVMDDDCTDNPASHKTCLKVTYKAPDEWGGVVWQSPPNDWGDLPGGYDLGGARALVFKARGDAGGEKVTFGVGLIAEDKPYHDSVRAELTDTVLTRSWNVFRVPLEGRDLSCVKSGFYWSLAGQGKPLTFYLDDIRFE